jgi:uncharacterized protein YndB with AHSA1/START domain
MSMAKTEFVVDRDKLQVRMMRVLNAPRERVWRAVTERDQVVQWWGPRAYTTVVDRLDLRVGGGWHFVHKDAKGNEYAFHGEYKAIDAPRSVTQTFVFEGIPDADSHALTETMTLTEVEGGKTKIEVVSQYNNIEELEGMVASGMESGAVESYDRLAELVEKS